MYDPKRTQVAQSLVDFGRYFDTIFARTRIGGPVLLRPALVVPEDMSTGGGRRARQSIILQPEVPGPPALTVGWLDIPSRQAMIRTWGCLAAMHRQRFPGRAFDVDRGGYEQFFKQTTELLKTCGLATQVEEAPPDVGPVSGAPSAAAMVTPVAAPSGYGAGVLAIVGVTCFVLGVVAGVLLMMVRAKTG